MRYLVCFVFLLMIAGFISLAVVFVTIMDNKPIFGFLSFLLIGLAVVAIINLKHYLGLLKQARKDGIADVFVDPISMTINTFINDNDDD